MGSILCFLLRLISVGSILTTIFWPAQAQQLYLNEVYRFSIDPPSGWALYEFNTDRPKDTAFFSGPSGTYFVVYADIRYASPEEAFEKLKAYWQRTYSGFRMISEGRVKVGEVVGSEVVWSGEGDIHRWVYVSRAKYDLFQMAYSSYASSYDAYLSRIDRAISSFRLVERLTLSVEPRVTSLLIDKIQYSVSDLPKSIWLEYGRTYSLSVEPLVSGPQGTRYIFDMWSDGNMDTPRKITISRSEAYTARYKTQYELRVNSDYGNPQGAGWYDSGKTVTFSVLSTIPERDFIGILGARNVFDHWSGDYTSSNPNASITMDSPKTVTAVWRKDYTQTYVIIGAVIIASILVAMTFVRKRANLRKRSPPQVTTMKYCFECGTEMRIDMTRCPRCGAKQEYRS